MGLIVQKFGGTSVADRVCIFNVANIIARRISEGNRVVTVVSAQGDDTDRLIAKAHEIAKKPHPREFDALVTTGEQVSAALLAIALNEMGISAVSLTGRQAGIYTDSTYGNASIIEINTAKIKELLDSGNTLVVTGFQGVDGEGDTTALGRGGSDTSAVALAAALEADSCRIYKDVDGIYSCDPRKNTNAIKYSNMTYDQMLEIVDAGSGVLQRRSVELAKEKGVELHILSSFQKIEGTIIGK
jgi:aspartate kinase